MKSFRATASVEVLVGDVPGTENRFLRALADKTVKVTLHKDSDAIESTLFGTYEIEGEFLDPMLGGNGKLEVDLLRNAWTVENIYRELTALRLTFEPNGSGQGAIYAVKSVDGVLVPDYEKQILKCSWGVDGKMRMTFPDGTTVPGFALF